MLLICGFIILFRGIHPLQYFNLCTIIFQKTFLRAKVKALIFLNLLEKMFIYFFSYSDPGLSFVNFSEYIF